MFVKIKICINALFLSLALSSFECQKTHAVPAEVAPEQAFDANVSNPNITFFGPNNVKLGSINFDPSMGPSDWRLSQWHTPGPLILRPGVPSGKYIDPYPSNLGSASYAQMTRNSRLAIFATNHGLIFELGAAHGNSTAGGGQNLFLGRSVSGRTPITPRSMINLRTAVPFLQMVGPKDNANAGQVFIGVVCDPIIPSQDHRGLFMQFVIADNRGAQILTPKADSKDGAIYASSNPEVHGAGVINFPLARGRCIAMGAKLHPVHVNLYKSLQKALNRAYDWTDAAGQHQRMVYPVALRDPSKWTLTSLYVGTEVQGPKGNATVRFSNIAIQP